MDFFDPDQPKVYFRKLERMDSEEICLDADMIRLLIAIDDRKDIARIADDVGMDDTTLNHTLKRLLALRLIEPVRKDSPRLGPRFARTLIHSLSRAVGPMAEILVEDAVANLGLNLKTIPKSRAAELISVLSLEIPDEEARIQFKKTMLAVIQ
jgi:predicted transcriptional regulator